MSERSGLEVHFRGDFLRPVIGAVEEDGRLGHTDSSRPIELLNIESLAEDWGTPNIEVVGITPSGFTSEMLGPVTSAAQRLLEPLYLTNTSDSLRLEIAYDCESRRGKVTIAYPNNPDNARRIPSDTWDRNRIPGNSRPEGPQPILKFKPLEVEKTEDGNAVEVTLPFKVTR